IQKLDFLYAAALPGRRYDGRRNRAEALRAGLDAIRRGAGADAFLLGCGCPLGVAVGVVDAMRIGADVTPYWTNLLARTVLRNTHGLATRHAIINTLTRAGFDRLWWRNDPDCLMVRDRDTKLSEEEVRLLATVFAMTDGMIVLSDRLSDLSPERCAIVRRARELAGGEVEVVDLFERQLPELVVSRHADRIDIGALNLGDRPRHARVDLTRLGIASSTAELREHWTAAPVAQQGSLLDFGDLPPHSARVVSVRQKP
ncbi:MAG TPA: hypothetical protein VEB21_18080, partial [Terriglobales bacterium]|nr:hypothetical protein [Terriglobales bacterium]